MRIAITGGIAEGKSTIMGYLRQLGAATASADEIARQILHRADIEAQIAALAELDLPLSRDELRRRISSDDLVRRRVNAVIHREVRTAIKNSSENWIEVPLLIETCFQGDFDTVWVVACGLQEQRNRLAKRLGNEFEGGANLNYSVTN